MLSFLKREKSKQLEDQLNAALRVAHARNLINQGKPINTDKLKSFMDQMGVKGRTVMNKIQRAIQELRS